VNKLPPSTGRPGWIRISAARQIPIAIVGLCSALSLGGDTARESLRYERSGLAAGEIWRLLSGHFVHLGWGHLVLNLTALGIMARLFEDVLGRLEWLVVTAASALAIDLGLYYVSGTTEWYVGLSGVLHGLLAAGSVKLIVAREAAGPFLLALIFAKLVWEQFGGPLPYSEFASGGPVIIDAHLFGAVGGIAGLMFAQLVRRLRASPV
jgi:rhomboid family GlyGly-CTERM serine protease